MLEVREQMVRLIVDELDDYENVVVLAEVASDMLDEGVDIDEVELDVDVADDEMVDDEMLLPIEVDDDDDEMVATVDTDANE